MEIAQRDRRLLARRGRRSAQGDRQEDPLADGLAEGQVHRGLRANNDVRPRSPRRSGTTCEKAQDYSFNKSHAACYALDLLPHRLAARAPPVRVHGGADQLGDEHEGPRAVLRQRLPRARDRGAAARRQRVADRLRRRRRARSASASTPSRASASSPAATIIRARAEGGPFESLWDFTERVDPRSSTSARSSRSSSAARCPARAWGCSQVLEQALACGPEAAGRPARRARARSSTSGSTETDAPGASTIRRFPTEEFEKGELLQLEKETLGLYVSEHPLSALRERAAAKTDATIAELERRRDGESSPSAASSARSSR